MTKAVKFEDPPERTGSGGRPPGGKYDGVAASLRANPGRWARVMVEEYPDPGTAARVAHGIRAGVFPEFQSGTWEARARTVSGESRVYARFMEE